MFKHAFIRGIQSALTNSGAAAFPDEATATKVADYVADRTDSVETYDDVRKVAAHIVEASDYLAKQPGYKAASHVKLSSWDDVEKLAAYHATQVMEKAAEGSTIEGGDKGNKEPTTGEGKMDLANRPAGYAEHSVGKTDVDTKPGMVGKESPMPNGPSESPSGSNSVTEHSKSATIANLFRKAAEGSTILGGDKGNTEPTTGEGKMDLANRPEGYARLPHQGAPGELPGMVDGSAIIGKETAHPNGPSETPGGTNSLTEHSAKAAADDAYTVLFKKVAHEIVEYIPTELSDDVKIAHIRACMGMTHNEKAAYLGRLQVDVKVATEKAAASGRRYDGRNANQRKQAGEMPDFMKKDEKSDDKKDDDKKDDDKKSDGLPPWLQGKIDGKKDEKSDDKKDDDKSDDDKKEAAVHDITRRIAAALSR